MRRALWCRSKGRLKTIIPYKLDVVDRPCVRFNSLFTSLMVHLTVFALHWNHPFPGTWKLPILRVIFSWHSINGVAFGHSDISGSLCLPFELIYNWIMALCHSLNFRSSQAWIVSDEVKHLYNVVTAKFLSTETSKLILMLLSNMMNPNYFNFFFNF